MSAKGKIAAMKLALSNRHLQDQAKAKAGLIVSARTSSGIEGIREPFERAVKDTDITDTRSFIAHWKLRTASKSAK
jgi:hypothetical protein